MRIKIASLNVKGRASGSLNKWHHMPQLMRNRQIGILAAQETHIMDEVESNFKELFGRTHRLVHSPDPETRNAKGVAFVLNRGMVYADNIKINILVPGRALMIVIPWKGDRWLTILNIYVPNDLRETREFWTTIRDGLYTTNLAKPDIMLGDFNLVEDALD